MQEETLFVGGKISNLNKMATFCTHAMWNVEFFIFINHISGPIKKKIMYITTKGKKIHML